MDNIFKKAINRMLSPVGLRVIRLPKTQVSGQYLFEDIAHLIGKDRPICIDVGANAGQTIESLMVAFQAPIIHAFEPSLHTFSLLRSREYAGSVHIHNLALGADAGERRFFNYGDSKLSSFLPLSSAADNPFRAVKLKDTEVAHIETVDTFLQRTQIEAVDLLKIDTQGFDFEVLKGARQFLRAGKIRCVLIELNFVDLYEGQAAPEDIFRYLAESDVFLVDFYEKVMQRDRLGWCTALFVHQPATGRA